MKRSEHVVAEPAELVAPDLGLGPGPDDRAVALVEVGELRRSTRAATPRRPGRARAGRATRRAPASRRRPRPRAPGRGLPCWRSRGRRCRARSRRASRCRRPGPRSSPSVANTSTPASRSWRIVRWPRARSSRVAGAGVRARPRAGGVRLTPRARACRRFPSRGARREGTWTRRRCHLSPARPDPRLARAATL